MPGDPDTLHRAVKELHTHFRKKHCCSVGDVHWEHKKIKGEAAWTSERSHRLGYLAAVVARCITKRQKQEVRLSVLPLRQSSVKEVRAGTRSRSWGGLLLSSWLPGSCSASTGMNCPAHSGQTFPVPIQTHIPDCRPTYLIWAVPQPDSFT